MNVMNLDRDFTDVVEARIYQHELEQQGFVADLQYSAGVWLVLVADDDFYGSCLDVADVIELEGLAHEYFD